MYILSLIALNDVFLLSDSPTSVIFLTVLQASHAPPRQ